MLQSLNPSSDKAAALMDELGISAYDAQGNFVGMQQYAANLQAGLKDLSVEQQNAALKTIFGSDAVRAAAIIFRDGASGAAEWQANVNDAGFAAETAATKLDNLKGDLEELGGALETALIGTGSGSQGMLRGLTQDLTGVVNAYNDLGDGAKSGVAVALGAIAALGGGVFVFSKVVQGVANTREAMDNLGISLDGVRGKAALSGTSLSQMATKGAALAGTVILVNQLLDGLGRVDGSKIDRGLEALTRGASTEDIDKVVASLVQLEQVTGGPVAAIEKLTYAWDIFGSSSTSIYADNVAQVDEALASLVEGGNIDAARAQFDAFATAAQDKGISLTDIKSRFTEYQTALENSGAVTDIFTQGFGQVATLFGAADGAAGGLTAALQENTSAAEANATAQAKIRSGARDTAGSFLDISKGADDANISLGAWIQSLADQAAALRDFTANAEAAAERGLGANVIRELEDLGPAGALRLAQLADASKSTKADIDALNAAFGDRAGARREFADSVQGITAKLRELPKEAVVDMRANGVPMTAEGIERVTRLANLTPREVRTLIRESGAKLTQTQIKRLIDLAKDLDRQRPNPRISAKDDASSVMRNIRQGLAALDGTTARTYIRTVRLGPGKGTLAASGFDNALGGIYAGGVQRFARGGFGDMANNHQPELYRGTTRVWGEPETKGEAYIPLADDYRRPRAQAIALETVSLLGGVAYFADGGRTGPSRSSRGGGDGALRSLGRLKDALDKSTKSLEREKRSRDDLISARSALRSSVSSAFTSDPFEVGNVWAAGGGDPRSILRADIAAANEQKKRLISLRRAGLDSQALASVAEDATKATTVLAMGGAGIREYERLFNQRAKAAASLGTYAGNAVYNPAIRIDDRQIRGLRGEVRELRRDLAAANKRAEKARKSAPKKTGQAVAKGVNQAPQAAKRRARAGRA